MKFPWFAALLLPAALAQPASEPKPAVLEGKVVDSITGAPLRKAGVTVTTSLIPEGMEEMGKTLGLDFENPLKSPKADKPKTPRKSYGATTDIAGKFRLDRIDAGDYYVTVQHAGYVDLQFKPPLKYASEGRLHLAPGDQLTDLAFPLVPQGAITGLVVDEDGDAVPDAMVTAMSYSYASGRRRLGPADFATTDQHGQFHLGKLPPGRYYLGAELRSLDPSRQAPPAPADGSPETGYVLTYFPKAMDVSQAEAIEVKAASDLSGFSIRLQKSRVVRVKGSLASADGTPIRNAQLMLMSGGRPGSMRMVMVGTEGKFELAGLQPGSYMAMVMQMGGGAPTVSMQPLIVPDANLENVKLGAPPDGKLQGKVVVTGDSAVALKGLPVMLVPDESASTMPVWGSATESGAFTLEKVAAVPYLLSVPSAPPGTYLKSILWNGRETLGQPLDFTSGTAGDLQIVLATDGGKVDVAVSLDDKPLPGATIVLLPADASRRFAETVKRASSDAAGHAAFADVPPGDYVAFAWEKVEEGQWFDPDFVKPLAGRATRFTVGARGNEKLELKAIPAGRR